jgi:hypothetical protein
MDVDRLTVNKQNKLMKEGRCFKCRNTGHRANECPEENDDKKKGQEVPKKKMNRRVPKKRVFKEKSCLDVSVSLLGRLLCNHS